MSTQKAPDEELDDQMYIQLKQNAEQVAGLKQSAGFSYSDRMAIITSWADYRSQKKIVETQKMVAATQRESTDLQRTVAEETRELIRHSRRLANFTKWLAIGTFFLGMVTMLSGIGILSVLAKVLGLP
jgi:hypothetical protein